MPTANETQVNIGGRKIFARQEIALRDNMRDQKYNLVIDFQIENKQRSQWGRNKPIDICS